MVSPGRSPGAPKEGSPHRALKGPPQPPRALAKQESQPRGPESDVPEFRETPGGTTQVQRRRTNMETFASTQRVKMPWFFPLVTAITCCTPLTGFQGRQQRLPCRGVTCHRASADAPRLIPEEGGGPQGGQRGPRGHGEGACALYQTKRLSYSYFKHGSRALLLLG